MPPNQKPEPILGLELLRGLACLEVLAGHFCLRVKAFPAFPWLNTVFGWGYESVIVFFLLSGFVISRSQIVSNRSRAAYLKARFVRILPLYWIAVLLSIGTDYLLDPELRPFDIAGVLLFFQTQPGEDLTLRLYTNAPLWSLSHEMWFYLMFAVTIGSFQKTALYAWGLLGALANLALLFEIQPSGLLGHFCFILAMSPVWLAGVALSYAKLPVRFSIAQAMACVALIPALQTLSWQDESLDGVHSILLAALMFPLFAIAAGQNGIFYNWKTSGMIWLMILLLDVGLSLNYPYARPNLNGLFSESINIILFATGGKIAEAYSLSSVLFSRISVRYLIIYMGAISYAVYIIHSPFINGLGLLRLGNYTLFWILVVPVILVIASVMEFIIQPFVKYRLKTK